MKIGRFYFPPLSMFPVLENKNVIFPAQCHFDAVAHMAEVTMSSSQRAESYTNELALRHQKRHRAGFVPISIDFRQNCTYFRALGRRRIKCVKKRKLRETTPTHRTRQWLRSSGPPQGLWGNGAHQLPPLSKKSRKSHEYSMIAIQRWPCGIAWPPGWLAGRLAACWSFCCVRRCMRAQCFCFKKRCTKNPFLFSITVHAPSAGK